MGISEHEQNDRIEAETRLMQELQEGKESGEENGWMTAEEVRDYFTFRQK